MDANKKDRRTVLAAVACGSALLLSIWLIPGNVAERQNREQRAFPDLTTSNWADPATWATVDSALRDDLGAQVYVAEATASVSALLLHRSPNSSTYVSGGGQPFFASDFIFPCRTNATRLGILEDSLTTDAAVAEAQGVYALYVVAPDKSTIRRDELGGTAHSLLRCTDPVRETVQGWAAQGELPLVTLWDEVEEFDAERADDGGVYYYGDSHWNAYGASVFTTKLLERLVADDEAPSGVLESLENYEIEPGEEKVTDLFKTIGLAIPADRDEIVFDRPGVTTERSTITNSEGTEMTHYENETTDAPLVEGRTLILGDSFLQAHSIPQLSTFFEQVTFGSLLDYVDYSQYDRIIMERVQRNTAEPGWPTLTEPAQ
ncbi:hypothetical protein HD599_003439 [Conyzicola lurida]|uniref:AlgX/AlgJ SGNH hydrolase-like domain-containing protein n=1 Tax=Conyzicola lurida TaxID=1172621 RepID=A0A841ATW3_9MICO|nr:hypothetical protein [Conyzicola lurida]MBB5845116.1 hypothetical protein [Conyzicola lurida]